MPTWDASPPWLRPLGPPTRGKCDQNPATGFNLNPHASFDPNPPTSFEQSPAGSSNPNPPPTASFVQDPPTSFGQHSTASFEQNPPTSAAGPGPVRDENNNGSGSNHAGYSSHFSMVTFTSQSHNTANHTQVPPGLSIIVQPTRHHLGHRLALSVRPAGPRNNAMTMRSPSTALSTNYCGDARLVDNYSANIRPEESTSLFIKNLPAEATIPKILGSIRATGTVSSLHLNPRVPDPPHNGCAAKKIAFFSREAAAKFFQNTRGGFFIDGHPATVAWNRVLVAEHVGENASRVIIVRSPKGVVTRDAIANIVHQEIRLYDLTLVHDTDSTGLVDGFAEVEVHFGSFRAQAQSAFIVPNRALRGKGVTIRYGVDPCA